MSIHVADFGAVGDGDNLINPTDDRAALQAAYDEAAMRNCKVVWDEKRYFTSAPIQLTNFRSIVTQGEGTGDAETIANPLNMAGTTLVTNGNYSAFEVRHDAYSNENVVFDGILLRNLHPTFAGDGIKVIKGAANPRYMCGFEFRKVAAVGYNAAFAFQGMNTSNVYENFFGTTVFDQCQARDCNKGINQRNASLNLLSIYDMLFFELPGGGLVCEPDGEVGAGNGKGSMVYARFFGGHMEAVAGMYRTQPTPVVDNAGTVIGSEIHANGVKHEACGAAINPTTGDPLCLGANTALYLAGPTNYGKGYGEDTYPIIGAGRSLSSVAPTRALFTGGKSLSPATINAPTLRAMIPNNPDPNATGHSFVLPSADGGPFEIITTLRISDGQGGGAQHHHWGLPSNPAFTTTALRSSLLPGVSVSFGPGSSTEILICTVKNSSGWPVDVSFSVENLSGAAVLIPSH